MTKPQGKSWAPLLALLLAGPAQATTLLSPTVSVLGGNQVACQVTNGGAKPTTVKVELLDDLASNATLGGGESVTVVPDGSDRVVFAGTSGGNLHCRFTGTFSKALVRADIEILNSDFLTLLVAPAR
jgi:hypothetical protein